MTPLLTDMLQLAYSSYYFLPITLGAVLLIKKDERSFDHSLYLIIALLLSVICRYLLFPALGPRFTMNHLQHEDLRGLFLTVPIQELLNRLEGVKRTHSDGPYRYCAYGARSFPEVRKAAVSSVSSLCDRADSSRQFTSDTIMW